MEIKKEELTQEQKENLKKLYRRFILDNFVAGTLYMGFLFFANLSITVIDNIYGHEPQFAFLASVGSAVIILHGLFSTLEERRQKFVKEASEFLPKPE